MYVPNKTEYLNLSVLNMITGKNESIILIKYMPCKCKCKFNKRGCNWNRKWNNDKCRCECKKHLICEKYYIWIPSTGSCKDGIYLPSIIDDSVIRCDEIVDAKAKSNNKETKIVPKNVICETKSFYILLVFLLFTNALSMTVSVYCYMIKYKAIQKKVITLSRKK